MSELRPFLISLGNFFSAWHQQLEKLLVLVWSVQKINCNFWKTSVQTWPAQTHETRKCWMDSSAWSQRGQTARWGRPCLARRSAVQHNFSPQAKICTVGGPKFSKSFSKARSRPFPRRRHYMQIFCCIPQMLWASSGTDPPLPAARSNHGPAPRCKATDTPVGLKLPTRCMTVLLDKVLRIVPQYLILILHT